MGYIVLGSFFMMLGFVGLISYFIYLRDPRGSGQYKTFSFVVFWNSILLIIIGLLSIVN